MKKPSEMAEGGKEKEMPSSIIAEAKRGLVSSRQALRKERNKDPLDRSSRRINRAKKAVRMWRDIAAKANETLSWRCRCEVAPKRAMPTKREARAPRAVSTSGASSSPGSGDDDGDPDQPEPPSPARALWRCGRPSDSLPSRLTLLDPNNLAGVLASASNAVASFDMGWTR